MSLLKTDTFFLNHTLFHKTLNLKNISSLQTETNFQINFQEQCFVIYLNLQNIIGFYLPLVERIENAKFVQNILIFLLFEHRFSHEIRIDHRNFYIIDSII